MQFLIAFTQLNANNYWQISGATNNKLAKLEFSVLIMNNCL
tara:strand:+ start:389 stop:511 length:123 start_codon:yes stop_codon:yes gene_type:complete